MAKLLSKGFNNKVYAVQSGEFGSPLEGDWVAKLFTQNLPYWELEALTQMRTVNKLMVKAQGIVSHKDKELLIMERLYPVQPRALDKNTRLEYLQKFLQELRELHENGWAHGDIQRPAHVCTGDGDQWDNVIPTMWSIRLIDAGIAVNEHDPLFEEVKNKDLADFCEFSKWFMKDIISEKDMIPYLRQWLGL